MMAHTCPQCGKYCDRIREWDYLEFEESSYCQCDDEDMEEDWEDIDDEWDDEVEEAFRQSVRTTDGGIVDPDNPDIIHYPCTNK